MRKALITGAGGFLGRHTAQYFKKRGWHVTGIDPVKAPGGSGGEKPIDVFLEKDVNSSVLKECGGGFEVIVHCAGSGSVGYSNAYPAQDFERNVITLLSVLEYMRLYNKTAILVLPSSAAVYGKKRDKPLKETDSLTPISPYGFHKRIAEELSESYAANYALNILVIRFFSLYGAGLKKQLLWDACNKLLAGDGTAVFSGKGNETRDWLHIDDAVSLIYHAAKNGKRFEIVNGGSGRKNSIKEVLDLVAREMGNNQRVSFDGKTRAGDPKYYHADITHALGLGWRPKKTLADGVREYVRWFKKIE